VGSVIGGAGGTPSTEDQIDAANKLLEDLAAAKPKVEVVLFQDCWMSTLETAYQIKDVAKYAIASQSLVPIGLSSPTFIWPYEQLFADLLTTDFQDRLTNNITQFYGSNQSAIGSHLRTLPISLLDLSKVDELTKPLGDLVNALSGRTLSVRGAQIESGRLFAFNPPLNIELSAGDAALVDVALMCANFANNDTDPAVRQAAQSLLKVIQGTPGTPSVPGLVRLNAEVGVPVGLQPLGFAGVSVLYWPPQPPGPDDDTYITKPLVRAFYENLVFQTTFTQDKWPALEQRPSNLP
jgi:hypothetical protein